MRIALRLFLLRLLKTWTLLGFLSCGAVHAAANSFDGYAVASNEELDSMRGGFEFSGANGTQFLLAFTYDQVSVINGVVVAVTSLNLLQLLNGGTLASALTTRLFAPPPTVADATHAATSGAGTATLSVSPRLAANLAQVDKVFSSDHPSAQGTQISTTQVQSDQPNTPNVGTSLIDKTVPLPSLPSPIVPPAASPPMSTTATSSGWVNVPTSTVAATPAAGVQVSSLNGMTLITSGPGNSFDSQALNTYLSTFIQNTVNDQVIRNVTILNATIASRQLAALAELNAALSRGIAAAIR